MKYYSVLYDGNKTYEYGKNDTHPSHVVRAILQKFKPVNDVAKVKVWNETNDTWNYKIKNIAGKYVVEVV